MVYKLLFPFLLILIILYMFPLHRVIVIPRNVLVDVISNCCFQGTTLWNNRPIASIVLEQKTEKQTRIAINHESLHLYYMSLSQKTKSDFNTDFNTLIDNKDDYTIAMNNFINKGIAFDVPYTDVKSSERFAYIGQWGEQSINPILRKYYNGYY